jgi:acyl dehydratase
MRHPDPVEAEQRYFEDVRAGDAIPAREYGPHTLTSAVFWAAVQENAGLLHFDRDYVRAQRGAKSIVVSGQQRQSYVVRTLLDWTGPRGFLRTMDCRHRASTHEGEMQIYSATVTGKSDDPQSPWITVEVDGRDQDGQQILTAKCTLLLPLLDWPLDRHVWETETPE